MKLTAFVFTRNRASQLRLLLRSLEKNCPQLFTPYILWRADNERHLRGYSKLQQEAWVKDMQPIWVSETRPVKDEFLAAMKVAAHDSKILTIYTDDTVFFRNFKADAEDVVACFDSPEVLSFSFRLGNNTVVQDYATGRRQRHPIDVTYGHVGPEDVCIWNWKGQPPFDNYGYPFAMDGCAYRALDLIQVTQPLQFSSFRAWEGTLSNVPHRQSVQQSIMVSPVHSCVVNIPANSIQDPPLHHSPKISISAEELNERYLANEVIDLDAMELDSIVGAHQEIAYRFRKL